MCSGEQRGNMHRQRRLSDAAFAAVHGEDAPDVRGVGFFHVFALLDNFHAMRSTGRYKKLTATEKHKYSRTCSMYRLLLCLTMTIMALSHLTHFSLPLDTPYNSFSQ